MEKLTLIKDLKIRTRSQTKLVKAQLEDLESALESSGISDTSPSVKGFQENIDLCKSILSSKESSDDDYKSQIISKIDDLIGQYETEGRNDLDFIRDQFISLVFLYEEPKENLNS